MAINRHYVTVRVTHIDSGECCVIGYTRSYFKNRDIAINILKSRLYATSHGIVKSDKLHSYIIPDGDNGEKELHEYLK